MLTVLIGDAMATARVLCDVDAADAPGLLDRLIAEAHAAHLYRKYTGRAHPVWGNGSLMARAQALASAGDRPLSDVRYLACLALVFQQLRARASLRPARIGADCGGTPPHAIVRQRQGRAAWARRG